MILTYVILKLLELQLHIGILKFMKKENIKVCLEKMLDPHTKEQIENVAKKKLRM